MSTGWRVRRAWPRGERIDLELEAPDGSVLAAVGHGGRIRPVGADDPRLPALAGWARRPGARLLGHRPGRRAVLHVEGSGFVKVLRPVAVERAVRAHADVAVLLARRPSGPRVPCVVEAGLAEGWFRLSTVPGRPLHDLLCGASTPVGSLGPAGRAAGECLAALAATEPTGLPAHDAAAECAVLAGAVERLVAHSPLGPALAERVARLAGDAAAALAALPPATPVLAHRDLHDKQVLVRAGADGPAGLVDLDTAAAADPGLDEANLLAHLDLRVWQGRTGADAARRLADALVEARAAQPGHAERVRAYRGATRARLAALYSFRPGARRVVPRLLTAPPVVGDC